MKFQRDFLLSDALCRSDRKSFPVIALSTDRFRIIREGKMKARVLDGYIIKRWRKPRFSDAIQCEFDIKIDRS